MTVNEQQIGGNHYKSNYQHWDFIEDHGIGYLEGCATKYLTRWRKKNGIEDLLKARHYIVKLLQLSNKETLEQQKSFSNFLKRFFTKTRKPRGCVSSKAFGKFCEDNQISGSEEAIIFILCTDWDIELLKLSLTILDDLIEEEKQFNDKI